MITFLNIFSQTNKKTRTNNTYNFILYNSCSMHNCIKTYNKKKVFSARTVASQARWLPRMLKVATLQDRISAVAELHRFILCTRHSGGTAHDGGGCDQSIGSTVSDTIVRSWLWSTTTRSSTLGYFSNYCK